MGDIMKNLAQYSKEEMMSLKQEVFLSYRVELEDVDLRAIIGRWTSDREEQIIVMKANGLVTGQPFLNNPQYCYLFPSFKISVRTCLNCKFSFRLNYNLNYNTQTIFTGLIL